MTVTLYGIPNCTTVRKARAWLDARGVAYQFHDYKKLGIDAGRLGRWMDELGWEALLNRSGTTFRKLPEGERQGLDRARAIALMIAHPSTIRRPVVEGAKIDGKPVLLTGFAPETYEKAFAA